MLRRARICGGGRRVSVARFALGAVVVGGLLARASESEALQFLDVGDGPLEHFVSDPLFEDPLPTSSPTTAWIASTEWEESGGVLVGQTYHVSGVGDVSAWSWTERWQADTDWGFGSHAEQLRSDDPALPWPEPVNSLDVYPDTPSAAWRYTGVAEVTSTGMADVGVLASYAFSPDVPLNESDKTDVVIVSAELGIWSGPNLVPAYSYVLSQIVELEENGHAAFYRTGGLITPGSVDIALSVQAERFAEEPSPTPLPIYVVWENWGDFETVGDVTVLEYQGWWIAAVTVGPDGSIALYDGPRKLDFIPYGSYVSVASRLEPDGDEVVELAWAEVPNGPNCGGTTPVTWYHAISIEGDGFRCPNEDCTSGSGIFPYGETVVDSDPNYRFCVGGSSAGGHAINVASPRPEIAFNDLGDMEYGHQRRFLAYPKSDDGSGEMKIHVMRDLFLWGDANGGGGLDQFDWELVFASSVEGDAFAPALHISPGRMEALSTFPFMPLDEDAHVAVLYRQADTNGAVQIYTASSVESGDPLTWSEDPSSLSDWAVTAPFEFRQGLTAMPRCMDADDCVSSAIDPIWFGVWTDERNLTGPQIWGGTYVN